MNCHEVKERLTEERATAAVRRHVAACPDCADFLRELEAGGREIAEAFLAGTPSPGFEARVGHRLVETEIAVRPRPRGRLARAAAVLLAVAAAGAAWVLLHDGGGATPAPAASSAEAPPAAPPASPPVVVLTEAERENPLYIRLGRESSAGRTTLDLSFAGESRQVALSAGIDEELLRAWARGARRAEVTVGPEVPTREILTLIDGLDRAGLSFDVLRPK